MKKKIFLICPIKYGDHIKTKEDEKTQKKIRLYVKKLEKAGNKVHWPLRDTNQEGDPIGLRVCTDNAKAIMEADEIHFWWNTKSRGSLFDLGMSFFLYLTQGKKIILANPEEVDPKNKKSFNNVLLALHATNTEGENK